MLQIWLTFSMYNDVVLWLVQNVSAADSSRYDSSAGRPPLYTGHAYTSSNAYQTTASLQVSRLHMLSAVTHSLQCHYFLLLSFSS